MSLPHNLKTLRRSINWTQKQTAFNLNIKIFQYQSYEEARAEPPICMLIKIAKLFNVTVDHLINRKMELKVAIGEEVQGANAR